MDQSNLKQKNFYGSEKSNKKKKQIYGSEQSKGITNLRIGTILQNNKSLDRNNQIEKQIHGS